MTFQDNIQILTGQIFDIRPHLAFHLCQMNFFSYEEALYRVYILIISFSLPFGE